MKFVSATAVTALVMSADASLRSEKELTHSCFNFPSSNFNRGNSVKSTFGSSPHTAGGLKVGDSVYDFTLQSVEGESTSLSELLAVGKPVVMVWGMWTCPAYQGLGTTAPFDECSYKDEWNLVEQYKDSVTFVHLVGPEPHPISPDTNFDTGKQLMNFWSTVRQPTTKTERLQLAEKVADYTHPSTVLLVDSLADTQQDDYTQNNPVWCTMGLGARTAMLVGPDGTLQFKQDWFHAGDTSNAIESYLDSKSADKTTAT